MPLPRSKVAMLVSLNALLSMMSTESGTVSEVRPEFANANTPMYFSVSGSSISSSAEVPSNARSSMLTRPFGRSTFSRLAQEAKVQYTISVTFAETITSVS